MWERCSPGPEGRAWGPGTFQYGLHCIEARFPGWTLSQGKVDAGMSGTHAEDVRTCCAIFYHPFRKSDIISK